VRRYVRWGLTILLALMMFALFYGPFFAWLPWTPGFTRIRTPDVHLLYRTGHPPLAEFATLPEAASEVERMLGLEFQSPARITLCSTWNDFDRFVPQRAGERALGGVSLNYGDVVVITPRVRDRPDVMKFVLHELVHVLVYQHMGILERASIHQFGWVVEGAPIHFSDPATFHTRAEFKTLAASLDIPTIVAGEGGLRTVPGGPPVAYSVYGYFTGYVRERFGDERFRAYMRAFVRDPGEHRETFGAIFGNELTDAARDFQNAVRSW